MLSAIGGLCLIVPGASTDIIGYAALAVVLVTQILSKRRIAQ